MNSFVFSSLDDGISRRDVLRCLAVAGLGATLGGGIVRAGDSSDRSRSAPSLSGAQPGFYRFNIGAFEAIAFNDGAADRPVAESPFGVGESPEEITAVLREAFLPATHLHTQYNVLLVRIGGELVLFDTGCGTLLGAAAGKLVERMKAAGVSPEQVTAVILTHAHRDHFGGLIDAESGRPVFGNAAHYVGRREFEFWTGANPDLSKLRQSEAARAGAITGARRALEAIGKRWQLVAPGDQLIEGLEIVEAFGHTPGHLAFLISSGADQLLHIVDTGNHHVLSFARPGWVSVFDVDPEQAEVTRRRLFDRAAADRLRVFGAHMPFPALGHVRRGAERGEFEYVIAPWRAGVVEG